jgi:hypothetical protein
MKKTNPQTRKEISRVQSAYYQFYLGMLSGPRVYAKKQTQVANISPEPNE